MTETIHVVVMGVSGSGKTTVAGILQDRWGWQLAEADDFHPQSNIDKMHSGIPLTDDDRWPWLETIRTWMTEHEEAGRSTIVTCSALKKMYRDVLRRGAARVIFMHLDGDHALLASRLATRTDHFMPSSCSILNSPPLNSCKRTSWAQSSISRARLPKSPRRSSARLSS